MVKRNSVKVKKMLALNWLLIFIHCVHISASQPFSVGDPLLLPSDFLMDHYAVIEPKSFDDLSRTNVKPLFIQDNHFLKLKQTNFYSKNSRRLS